MGGQVKREFICASLNGGDSCPLPQVDPEDCYAWTERRAAALTPCWAYSVDAAEAQDYRALRIALVHVGAPS
jgi:hypothetical protein